MGPISRIRETFRIQEAALGEDGAVDIAVLFVLPPSAALSPDPLLFFCLPGGSLDKSYFDLDADGDRSFSFAEAMAARGHISILIDHPGVGESGRPEDGYLLHPDVVARIDHAAGLKARARLEAGLPGYPPIQGGRTIGVGHSMGGMFTGVIQATYDPFDAVAILGSGPYGYIEMLMEPLKPFANDPAAARRELVPTLKAAGIDPYLRLKRTANSGSLFDRGDPRGVAAIKRGRSDLLSLSGFFVMIPGAWAPEAAKIETPVLLAYGDDDLCRTPHQVPAFFPGSSDITLVVLPDTGHNHFAFTSRQLLFDRLAAWAEALPAA